MSAGGGVGSAEVRALQAGLLALAPAAGAVGGIGPMGLLAAALLGLGGALLPGVRERPGRWLATAGLVVAALGWGLRHPEHPAGALVMILWAGALILRIWPGSIPAGPPRPPAQAAAAGAAWTVAAGWLLDLGQEGTGELALLTVSALLPAALSAAGWRAAVALALPVGVLGARLLGVVLEPGAAALVVGPALLLLDGGVQGGGRMRQGLSLFLSSPARLLVVSFAALCLGGTVLLAQPLADPSGQGHPLLDAAFTAVSASCVTGLGVLDTPRQFTVAGQAIILLLIQVGGLGIMTFASAALLGVGRRLTLQEEAAAAHGLGRDARGDVRGALGRVLGVTLLTEALGAALLAPLFWLHGDGLVMGLWRAVFTSISAFCNAGFALQSDNLMGYQGSPGVLLVVGLIILTGGLGPTAVVALPMLQPLRLRLWLRRPRPLRWSLPWPWPRSWARGAPAAGEAAAVAATRPLPLEIRLMYWMTLALVLLPAIAFLALEAGNTLEGMGLGDRIVNAWFQSVTLRTAGFNSVDLTAVAPATLAMMVVVMFIGGSPGSTAGGVKTTTMAVLLLGVAAVMRGRTMATFDGRRIPHRVLYQATAITTVAVFCVTGALGALLLTQEMPFEVALFEVVSAMATVGLTVGGTPALDEVGKIIVMLCMFAGRVGPLTLFIFLTEQAHRPPAEYPSEDVAVG